MIMKNKKAISELITYVLIVSLTLALAGIIYGWLKFYTSHPFPEQSCPEVSVALIDYRCAGGIITLTIQNRGRFDIDGYILKINNGTREYTLHDPNMPLSYIPAKLGPGENKTGAYPFTAYNQIIGLEMEAVKGFDKYDRPILCENSISRIDIKDCKA